VAGARFFRLGDTSYFAFVHRYTSIRVASHVTAQHRQTLTARGKAEIVIDWTLPLLQKFTRLAALAHEELTILRLLIAVLRDAVRNGGSAGGGDAWRTPLPDDVYRFTQGRARWLVRTQNSWIY
jgi:hypothetical protein